MEKSSSLGSWNHEYRGSEVEKSLICSERREASRAAIE